MESQVLDNMELEQLQRVLKVTFASYDITKSNLSMLIMINKQLLQKTVMIIEMKLMKQ